MKLGREPLRRCSWQGLSSTEDPLEARKQAAFTEPGAINGWAFTEPGGINGW